MTAPPRTQRFAYREVEADFQHWMQKERLADDQVSAYTAHRYSRYAAQLCAAVPNILTTTDASLAAWRASLEVVKSGAESKPATPQTVNVKLAAARAFFDYLMARGLRKDNPARGFVMQRVRKRKPAAIPRAVMKTLFKALYEEETTPEVQQDRALLETLYGSGLRRVEAANLTLANIQSREVLYIAAGKGDKDRRTMISEPQYKALREWCLLRLGDERTAELRKEISDDAAFDDLRKRMPTAPIFYTPQNVPITKHSDPGHFVWARAKYWFNKIGEKRKTHHMRHSFVTHLLDNDVDLLAVSDMVGHSDLRTTRLYRGQGEETFARARRAHPRV